MAPQLVRVQLDHGANGIVNAGKGMAAGLLPALVELIVPKCHGNMGTLSGPIEPAQVGWRPEPSCARLERPVLQQTRCGRIGPLGAVYG